MDVCGIYKIENKLNGHIYIGQSINIHKRWREHICASESRRNRDYILPIHAAFRKYGLDNFDFSVIEECKPEDLNEREVYWIQHYDSYKHGYNATEGGNESHIHIGVPVELYDLDGNYITEYPNITEAAKAIGVCRGTIYGILYGDRLSSKGYQFKRKDSNEIITPYKSRKGGKIPILQLKNGEVIQEFESATDAARQLNLDSSAITKCCKGKLKTTGGFGWRYKEG